MKTKISSALFLCAGVLLLAGCFKDKGNYTYKAMNEVTIEFPENKLAVLVGDSFSLSPTVTSTMPAAEGDYEYTWLLIAPPYVDRPTEEVYDGKDIVNWLPDIDPGTHTLVLRVTDTRTSPAIDWFSPPFELSIQNPMGRGIALLTEKNDLGKVEMLAWFDDDFVRYEAEGLPEMTGPTQIVYYNDPYSPYFGHTLTNAERGALVAISGSGAYRLNPTDLTYDDRMDVRNAILGDLPGDFRVASITPGRINGTATLIGNDGNMYLYSYGGTGTVMWAYGLTYNHMDGMDTFECAPWVAHFNMARIIYNSEEGSFFKANDKANYTTRIQELEPPAVSNFAYTGRDMVWMQGRYTESTEYDKVYALMKDSEGVNDYDPDKRYLVSFPATAATMTYTEYDVTEAEAIRDGVDFCITRNNKAGTLSLLYYRDDTKIYVYDFNAKTTTVVYETTGSRVLTYIGFMTDFFVDNMVVCTWDPAAEGSGQVEVFNPASDATGALLVAEYGKEGDKKPIRFDGFDRIVSACWKYHE